MAGELAALKADARHWLTSPAYAVLHLRLENAHAAVEAALVEARRKVRLNAQRAGDLVDREALRRCQENWSRSLFSHNTFYNAQRRSRNNKTRTRKIKTSKREQHGKRAECLVFIKYYAPTQS